MQDEFYAIAFRKKIYETLDQLQIDLDAWMEFYNTERPHSGRYCFGKTPMQTFLDSKTLAKAKDLNLQFLQNATFKVSGEADVGSAEEQPTRNALTDGNERAVASITTALPQKSFLSQMP